MLLPLLLWLPIISSERFYMGRIEDSLDNVMVEPKVLSFSTRMRRSDGSDLEVDARKRMKGATVMEVEDWILVMEENRQLSFQDGFERWSSNDSIRQDVDCKLYHGNVLYDPLSKAVMTICDGNSFYGFLETGQQSFFLEPTSDPPGGHLMYKANIEDKMRRRRCAHCVSSDGFNLMGDLLDDADFNFSNEDPVIDNQVPDESIEPKVRKSRHDEDDVAYFIDSPWETRPYIPITSSGDSPGQERWLEMALAVDYTVIDFHGKDKIKPYIMTLMNIVSAIYKDPSLESNMHLVLSRLMFYESKKDTQVRVGNAKKSLEAVNRWNYHLIGSLPKGEKPHDIAVWLTREYIGGPSGYAPVAGVCDRSRSTALNKDEGLASAFIIAHEMAHILGLTHDGDEKAANKCIDEVQKGTVMAPTVTAAFNRFSWSSCSKEEFHKLITQWTCLSNPPHTKNLLEEETSYTFSMDEQCRMEYGDGYGMCKSFELIEPCTHLWCGHQNSSLYCFTKKGPPQEGTKCGFDKWCVDGYCQAVDGRLARGREPPPRDGGWGTWTPWGPCAGTCGYGVMTRQRQCDSPEPEPGGSPCPGDGVETKACKLDKRCWSTPTYDSRAELCSKMAANEQEEWLPREENNEELECRVSCTLWSSGEVVRSGELLPDGTPCSYDNEHHICMKGSCLKHGCDGKENSTQEEDACGECGGAGRSCPNSKLVFRKILIKDQTKLTTFPRTSRRISIKATLLPIDQNTQDILWSQFYLIVVTNGRSYRLRGPIRYGRQRFEPSLPRSERLDTVDEAGVVVAGSAFRMMRNSSTFTLQASGPTHSEVTVMMASPKEYLNAMEILVELNYTQPAGQVAAYTSGRYMWILSKCKCGPRPAGPYCVDTARANQTVDPRRCSDYAKVNIIDEDCGSLKCKYRWSPGKWEYCSATCGESGLQHRQLYCIPNDVDDEVLGYKPWIYMVEPSRCPPERLPNTKSCNRIPCPVNWVEEPWNECSSTCGPGISIRPMRCVSSRNNTNDCGPPPAARWRSCHGSCPNKPCFRDKSPYCSLGYISKYCALPEFEKMCCVSCQRGNITLLSTF